MIKFIIKKTTVSYGGWLKTSVFKYKTSNIISQSYGLSALLKYIPPQKKKNLQGIYNSECSHSGKMNVVNVGLSTFILELLYKWSKLILKSFKVFLYFSY